MNMLQALKQLRDDIKVWVTNNLNALNAKIDEKTIPVDSELSSTSTNPVQNRTITNAINNIPRFSGDYNDLTNAPNITEDDGGNMIIADESGNIIMRVDSDGVSTTNVIANTIELNGEDLGDKLDEIESTIPTNIVEDESGKLEFADEAGNVIARLNEDGFETTKVTAKSAVINGIDVTTKHTELEEDIEAVRKALGNHTSNSTVHITADERTSWNNKSDFSGDYDDLTNAPNIKEDDSGEVVYADEDDNIIAKIGENGFETTTVTAKAVVIDGVDVKAIWNAKADKSDIDGELGGKLDKNLGAEAKHKILGADAEGNVTPTNITWGEPTETVILEEQEFTPFSKLLEIYGCSVNYAIADIIVGETYSVIWDGVATTCTAVQNEAYVSLGLDGKFNIDILNNMTILNAFTDTSVTHTVGIVHIGANTSMAIGDDFVVYSDGHAEVQTMGETDNSVATKQYVDNAVANGTGSPGESGDMAKATYDTDNDGIVDNAAQLEGHPADYFATAEHAHTYESLIDAPDITQDPEDGVLYVVDGSGNIIMRVDEDGLATTTVTAKSIAINGNSIEDIINSSYAANTFIIDGGNAALAESEALS